MEMHRHSALQMLLGAFVRCSAWPEVELPVSRAIAHLVAVEDEVDWQTLQQSARDILSALQVLVSQSLSSELVRQQVRIAGGEASPAAVSEQVRLRELIAKAVFKLCFVLSKHWTQTTSLGSLGGSLGTAPARPPSWDFSENPAAASPSMSYRELRRSRGVSRVVVDVGQLLGMVANIISLLTGDDGPARHHVIDDTTVLCASAMLSLSKVKQGRQSFVTHGSMGLVARWLEEARFILADAYNRLSALPEDHLVFKLIANICGILVAVVSTSGVPTAGEHDYSIGWADSQLIATGVPATIVKVINSSIRFERSFEAIIESCVVLFDFRTLNAFSETLLSLSSRSHNRPQLTEAKVPTALCVLVLSTLTSVKKDIPIVIAAALHAPASVER